MPAEKVFPDNDDGYSRRSEIFLGAGVNQTEPADIQRPGQEIR